MHNLLLNNDIIIWYKKDALFCFIMITITSLAPFCGKTKGQGKAIDLPGNLLHNFTAFRRFFIR